MFILKKLLGGLLMPLPFSLVLLISGVLLLWFSHRWSAKQTWGKILLSFGIAILILTSLPYPAQQLNLKFEREYPPVVAAPTDLDYVMVLGGGHRSDPYLPASQQLHIPSFYRLMEGLRLIQANPGATLILSGYGGSDPLSNAQLEAEVAQQYGMDPSRIRLIDTARDTEDEATLIAPIIRGHKSALVTSASHMPRALKYFHAQGLKPLPAPTLFLAKNPQNRLFAYEQLPSANNLARFTVAWHEVIGKIWQWVRS